MKINLVHNRGSGFSGEKDVSERTTIGDLFSREMGASARPEDFLIRVNQNTVKASQELREGDYVSFTPTKIQGA